MNIHMNIHSRQHEIAVLMKPLSNIYPLPWSQRLHRSNAYKYSCLVLIGWFSVLGLNQETSAQGVERASKPYKLVASQKVVSNPTAEQPKTLYLLPWRELTTPVAVQLQPNPELPSQSAMPILQRSTHLRMLDALPAD